MTSEDTVTRHTIGATLKMIPLCQLALHFIDVSHVLKWNVAKRVNGGDIFLSMLLEISPAQLGHPCLSVTKFCALCAADPHFPCLGHSCTLCFAPMSPVWVQVSRGVGGSAQHSSPGCILGGHAGSFAKRGDLTALPKSCGSFWRNKAFPGGLCCASHSD